MKHAIPVDDIALRQTLASRARALFALLLRLEQSRATGRIPMIAGSEKLGEVYVVDGNLCGVSLPDEFSSDPPPMSDEARRFLSVASIGGLRAAVDLDEPGALALHEWMQEDIGASLASLVSRGLPEHIDLQHQGLESDGAERIAVSAFACFLASARSLFAGDEEPIDRVFQTEMPAFQIGLLFARSSGRPIPICFRGVPASEPSRHRLVVPGRRANVPTAVCLIAPAAFGGLQDERRYLDCSIQRSSTRPPQEVRRRRYGAVVGLD